MLLVKEWKKIVFSLMFVLYVAVVAAMYYTQLGGDLLTPEPKPTPGMDNYGTVVKEDAAILMPAATEELLREYLNGYYVTYPFFYKEVKPKENEKARIAEILGELTGLSRKELDNFTDFLDSGYDIANDENGNPVYTYREAVYPEYEMQPVTYEHFRELMGEVDEILGGNSSYAPKTLVNRFSRVPKTYETALAEYQTMMQPANLGKAYTRLYCDYLGIVLAVIPVFAAAFLWMADRRAHMQALVYSRKISSVKLVCIRYFALVSAMMLPVVVTFVHMMIKVDGLYPEQSISWLPAVGLGLFWLLPYVLSVTAVAVFFSELIGPLFAIFVQCIWWFLSLEASELVGGITRWTLLLRHNRLGGEDIFAAQFANFLWNRAFYLLLSAACLLLAALVFDKKRGGAFGRRERWSVAYKNIFRNRKNKSAA